MEQRVVAAFLFPNGNLAVFDKNGNQIPELQTQYSIETHKRILLEAVDGCEFHGFDILPYGFITAAWDWADYFRKQNMSYEEIKNL